MCTVSFIARKTGYALAMNRDEKLARVAGLPPSKIRINRRTIMAPSEPGGGTWIAVNDARVTFALINWYSIAAQVNGETVSRGEVVNAVYSSDSPASTTATLEKLAVNKINPFRLIGVFSATREVIEWQWNLQQLFSKPQRWRTQQWISSGFDESAAQRVRGETFQRALKQESAGSLDWLRRLHRSHSPQSGPFSTCMHRADAATVSYSEVLVSANRATLRYLAGSPCNCAVVPIRYIQTSN